MWTWKENLLIFFEPTPPSPSPRAGADWGRGWGREPTPPSPSPREGIGGGGEGGSPHPLLPVPGRGLGEGVRALWHIHLYHIFAYFNKLTPEGEGRADSGAHPPRFGVRVWGLTPSSRRPILPGVRRRGLEKGLRDSALLSSLIPSWGLGEGGVDKFSWQVKVARYSF